MRDMLLSMLVLAGFVLLLAGLGRSCSFSPGGPSVNTANLPTVDVSAELGAAAGQLRFPLRQPALPAGWRANSASQQPFGANGGQSSVDIGWLTADGRFVQLDQSNAAVPDLVRAAAGTDQSVPVAAHGQTVVGGLTWTIYQGVRSEQAWAHDFGPVRVLITGNGSTAEFTTMAEAVRTAPVVRGG